MEGSCYYNKKNNLECFKHIEALVNAACNSAPNGRYSDYSDDQIIEAFNKTECMLVFYVDEERKIPGGLALFNIENATLTIELIFTLPAGKGKSLVAKIIGYIRNNYNEVNFIKCNTYGFSWLIGPCISHRFKSCEDQYYKTPVLHFNKNSIQIGSEITKIATASFDDIINEKVFEHAPFSNDNDTGPLYKAFIESLITQGIITSEEMLRSRSDVRVSVLRPGQSGNPLGIHGDFTCKDEIGDFTNPNLGENLKIIVISSGKPGTRIFTLPIDVAISTNEWTHVWREQSMQKGLYGPNREYIDSQPGVPIIFDEMTLHEALSFDGKCNETVARLFMRLIIYPASRLNEIPTNAGKSLNQVYIKNMQM